ncbi:hypothetical protein BCR35DRAFT_217724 [Leucosporidium creatinivorum]|uniref:Complex 1 LYR protein domain-containing protein n=1 Tax=Leucosporidium creatinivorum TaxID=106004 RepID=A0A1Y2FYD0_9BASI|nr:hypothetical protein BCR35DRAFT_217724 [Leucosporidium creatinivorum]
MASDRARTLGLYRSLLRVALQMPDDHRRALVVFRARSEFELHRALQQGSPEQAERWIDGEVYRDNLEHQAAHLSALSSRSLLIPVDLRRQRSSSSSSHSHSHTCTDPTHNHGPPSPSLQPSPEVDDRRKLIRAVAARKDGATRKATGTAQAQSKFMQGPEPSWLKKKKEVEGGLKAMGGS